MFKSKKYLIGLVVLAVVAMVGTVALAQTGEQIISNVLSATVNSRYEKPVLLTWAIGTSAGVEPTGFNAEKIEPQLVVGGDPIYVWVKADNKSGSQIDRVLFLIKTDNAFTIERTKAGEPDWFGALPYDGNRGAYWFGPSNGFTMEAGYTALSEFKIIANEAGTFDVEVYTIQLPSS